SSSLSIHTPSRSRSANVARCASHTLSGTMTCPSGTVTVAASSARARTVQASLIIWPVLMSFCIDALLKGGNTNATIGVDERFLAGTVLHTDFEQSIDDPWHIFTRERGSQHIA